MFQVIYYLIGLVVAGGVLALGLFLNKKSNRAINIGFKLFSLLLAAFFIVRYMLGPDAIAETFKLENTIFDNKVLNFLAIILVWFTYSSNLLLELYGFFKVKRLNGFIKFIAFPIAVLNFMLTSFNLSVILGSGASGVFSLRAIIFAIEIGLALGYSVLIFVLTTRKREKKEVEATDNQEQVNFEIEKKYQKIRKQAATNFSGKVKNLFSDIWFGLTVAFRAVVRFIKKYWFNVFAVLAIFISTMPSYIMQSIFGYAHQVYKLLDFEIPHRIILYAGLLLPFIIHYSLRSKDYNERKFYLMFICLGTLLSYSFTKKFDAFLDPTSWPLHLCNTAMYIMPLVLIFNMKRLFYFTYFINVLGAFFAMLMPNYSSASNLFSQSILNFYINHYIAFFMPILFVSLEMFTRPKLKQFIYSMMFFAGYFVAVIFINALFTGLFEAGLASQTTDYFFVNSDFIADKLGEWAERLRDITASFSVNGITLTFYPVYQVLFFLAYVLLGLGVWFVYEQGYQIANSVADMSVRKQKIKLEQLALMTKMNGRSLNEPMNPENKNKLILRDFTKRYGNSEVLAVDKANLEVKGGEVFGFLGPNGAGKSTIIKTIVGIQPITSGEIEVCGYDVNSQPVEAKRCIGFVPDHYALYEKLTGREYINYIADLYGVPEKERNERIDGFVKRFELEGAFDNQMKTYSHGMKQKIAIMAALVHDPKVWILDEPLTGLDPNSIYQVKKCMEDRAKEGYIVFFSSHIIDVVEKICTRIAIIKKGHIIVTKSVKDIEKSGVSLEEFYMNTINNADVEAKKAVPEENGEPKEENKKSKKAK
ncbi:MAG: YwaF family protein [Clostridia bacterium]|nr:YwaF family protein [Clostridia bacterium]